MYLAAMRADRLVNIEEKPREKLLYTQFTQ